jgi:putative transposase
MDYRRLYIPGGTYYFTVVTHRRKAIFTNEAVVADLRRAFRECLDERPMTIDAAVILPDHFHVLVTLPDGDSDYSSRIGVIKAAFTKSQPKRPVRSAVRRRRHEAENWQPRFWEHAVRNADEVAAIADYIHYNPVKHGHAKCPHAWPWSSFHRWVARKWIEPDWSCSCRRPIQPPDFTRIADVIRE